MVRLVTAHVRAVSARFPPAAPARPPAGEVKVRALAFCGGCCRWKSRGGVAAARVGGQRELADDSKAPPSVSRSEPVILARVILEYAQFGDLGGHALGLGFGVALHRADEDQKGPARCGPITSPATATCASGTRWISRPHASFVLGAAGWRPRGATVDGRRRARRG